MTFSKFWLTYRFIIVVLFSTHVVAAVGGAVVTMDILLGLLVLGGLAFAGFIYLIVQKLQG